MSRSGSAPARTLSLTEELEKLEQSITLTLQEIDHNFSKAHRIVTTSILPLVEQYGEHSRSVWEASKFWKQFFEASANVSLSGYEELANDEDTTAMTEQETTLQDETTVDHTPRNRGADESALTADQSSEYHPAVADDSLLTDDGGDLSGSTPRPPATKSIAMKAQFADLGSPYEALKRELKDEVSRGEGTGNFDTEDEDTEILFQQHTARLPDMSMTPSAGAASDESADRLAAGTAQKKDPLLHRVLDKNYRLMATPHKGITTGVSPIKWKVTEKAKEDDKGKARANVPIWQDSPMSSPEMAVPKLRTEAFMSPVRTAYRGRLAAATAAAIEGPRTPGVSVQTPVTKGKTRDVYADDAEAQAKGDKDEITWESDSDGEDGLYGGMSPPKTIQFALVPSKLLQTPAREAGRRIVDDILLTAGAEPEESLEYSPTMVRMNENILDDTF